MIKKTRGQIFNSILKKLEKKNLTANELAEEIGSNWDTVKSNLDILEEIGLCEHIIEGKKKAVYRKKQYFHDNKENRTWFNIPIGEEHVKKTELVFGSAKQAWIKWANKEPNNIQLEKTVFELIQKNSKYEIPMGWYLYGPMAQMRIQSMNLTRSDKFLVDGAKEIVQNQNKKKYTISLISDLYERYKKQTHLCRVKFDEQLRRGIYSKEHKIQAILNLNNIARHMSVDIELFNKSMFSAQELLDAFITLTSKLLLFDNFEIDDDKKEITTAINETFILLWTLISKINYFENLKKYVDKDILKETLGQGFVNLMQDVEISLDMLKSLLPQEKIEPNPKFAKFVGV